MRYVGSMRKPMPIFAFPMPETYIPEKPAKHDNNFLREKKNETFVENI